jgi:uncharacterized protein YwqG
MSITKAPSKASQVHIGGFRPTGDPFATHFGLKPLGTPCEEWPAVNQAPLLFVCQLNLMGAPVVPPVLRDMALITFFVAPENSKVGRENGDNWVLRAYPSLEGLVPLTVPQNAPKLKRGFECSWQECHRDETATKVGGRLSQIQSEPWWDYDHHDADPKYCLQINSEEKVGLFWGDAGMVYLARGAALDHAGEWFLDWQCY